MQGYDSELAPDGRRVQCVVLRNAGGLEAQFMDWGATWLSCQVPVQKVGSAQQLLEHSEVAQREVLLRSPNFAEHLKQSAYFGATVGRYANRIRNAAFTLPTEAGVELIQLTANDASNSLHGGVLGFSSKRWQIETRTSSKVTFSLHSLDGEQGFPGNLHVLASYEVTPDNAVVASFEAATDKPCPVNLTNHAYFNLASTHDTVLLHELKIHADHFLPVLETGIPEGELQSVVGTSFDFRIGKTIGQDLLADVLQSRVAGYDHGFLLHSNAASGNAPAAWLTAPDRKVQLSVTTTKPALQVYTGNHLAGTLGATGQPYAAHAGVALETEFLPDAPNHPEWPHASSILLPGQRYAYRTEFRFTRKFEAAPAKLE